jgi:UDP-N-acetylglucosamine-lysosomal-enzyme
MWKKLKKIQVCLVFVTFLTFTTMSLFRIPSPFLQPLNEKEELNISIDVVYTWVNGSDPEFIRKISFYLQDNQTQTLEKENRFYDYNSLKYSLRSLEKYAPWVQNVYIVTNGQVPNWLNLNNSRVHLITHENIFPNKSHLPTFSSPAIESHLFRINRLSNMFLYFNDDFLLTAPISTQDFFTIKNGHKIRLSWDISPHPPSIYVSSVYFVNG